MTGSLVASTSQFRIVRQCFLLVLVLLCSISAVAKCDDDPHLGVTPRRSQMLPQDQSTSSHPPDKATSESQVAILSAKAVRLLEDGNIEEAIVVQRQLLSVLGTLAGELHWRTKSEKTLLTEMEQVSSLAKQPRKTYLVGYQRLIEGGQKMALEDYGNAEELLDRALDNFTTVLGNNFVSVATTLEKLGVTSLMRGNPLKAKKYFARAAAVWKTIVGEDHPAYANTLTLAGAACLEARDFGQAEIFLREALHWQRRLFGTRDLRYAESLGRLSRVMIETKKLPEAEAMCLQAISIAEGAQRQDSPLMASYLFNLADLDIAYEEYGNADTNLRRSLLLYERGLPPWSPIIARVLDRHAWLLRKLNRCDEAKAMEIRAEGIRAQGVRESSGDRESRESSGEFREFRRVPGTQESSGAGEFRGHNT